ncbi:MAG: hypothetical protein WBF90_19430, partial [Rivularia sp. (in: cyanobacteria)]
CEGSESGGKSKCVGTVPATSGKSGSVEVGTSRKNSNRGNTSSPEEWRNTPFNGKVIDQLANEVEKQLEYYHAQTKQLEERLKELRELSGELEKINNSD